MNCHSCGASGAERWMLGLYSMNLCTRCGETNDNYADGFGNRPRRFDDIESERFAEGLADLVKVLDEMSAARRAKEPGVIVKE